MRLPTATAAILLVTLAGCAGDSGKPKADEIKAGACIAKDIADEDDRAPDLSTVVDCSEPHVYEILDVVDLPKEALTGKTDKEKLANRKVLATVEPDDEEPSAEREAYYEFADAHCARALRERTGYDDITVKGFNAEDASVFPAFGQDIYTPWFNLMPEKQWLDGERQLICSARFTDASDADSAQAPKVKPMSSPNDETLISSASSPSFPIDLRYCSDLDRKTDTVTATACDKQHYSESLFYFDGDTVFGVETMEPIVKAKDPSDEQMAPLDRACIDALPAVMEKSYDTEKVAGTAFIVEFENGNVFVECALVAADEQNQDLGPGTFAWSDAADVKLLDAK